MNNDQQKICRLLTLFAKSHSKQTARTDDKFVISISREWDYWSASGSPFVTVADNEIGGASVKTVRLNANEFMWRVEWMIDEHSINRVLEALELCRAQRSEIMFQVLAK